MQQPHILCSVGDVAENVLIAGDPARVLRAAEQLDSWDEKAYNREFRTVTGQYRGRPVSVVSTGIGGASTAIAVEELIACGAKRIIRIGSCGSLQHHVHTGDLVLAHAAVRGEGTSHKYVAVEFPAAADPALLQMIVSAAQELKYTNHIGIVHSHDSLYTPNQRTIEEHWHAQRVLASEMETATLFTLATLKGIQAAAILNVVVEYDQDVKEGIAGYNAAHLGEQHQITLGLEALFRSSQ